MGISNPPLIDAESLERDPHVVWDWLREHAPVHHARALNVTFVTRHADVERVSRDEATFSSVVPDTPLGRTVGTNMLHLDGPEHLALRELLSPIVRARVIRDNHAPPLIAQARQLLSSFGSTFDVVTDYARPLAETLITQLVGFLEQEHGALERWFRGIAAGASNFERDPAKQSLADDASAELQVAIDAALSNDHLPEGSLLRVYRDNPGHSEGAILAMVKLFIIGGLQEPRDLLSLSAGSLMLHPDELERVVDEPKLLARVVEESARWEAPVGTINRITTQEVELSGVQIPPGTLISAVLASANRDPRRWSEPARFTLDRDEGPHLSYAVGAHACIGAPAARMFVREMLQVLLPYLASAKLLEPVEVVGYEFRGPTRVVVEAGR